MNFPLWSQSSTVAETPPGRASLHRTRLGGLGAQYWFNPTWAGLLLQKLHLLHMEQSFYYSYVWTMWNKQTRSREVIMKKTTTWAWLTSVGGDRQVPRLILSMITSTMAACAAWVEVLPWHHLGMYNCNHILWATSVKFSNHKDLQNPPLNNDYVHINAERPLNFYAYDVYFVALWGTNGESKVINRFWFFGLGCLGELLYLCLEHLLVNHDPTWLAKWATCTTRS